MTLNAIPPTDARDNPPPATCLSLDGLVSEVLARSREDKKALLYQLLRDLLGEQPADECGIYNADGSSYIFLVPPRLHAQYHVTPERLAQWQRDLAAGETIPLRETVARLRSMNQ
jgi:hypothetical protein